MHKASVFLFILLAAIVPVSAQEEQMPLDRYLETGKTIVIATALSVGPVNILLRSRVVIQILHVVKGKETRREMTIVSEVDMEEGKTYLLRTENEAVAGRPYFMVQEIDSAILISRHEDIEELRKLSPRIVVLRTMNQRLDHLEDNIRRLKYEMDALTAVRKETK